MTKPTLAILGGSGKEGSGLALRWAAAGYPVVLGSRSAERAEEAAAELTKIVAIIDSMTLKERRTPKIIDPSRRNRIAKGAGVEVSAVTQLLKQYEAMLPLMRGMAGEGLMGRLKKMRELQAGGLFNPGAQLMREKKGTGKRLTNKEKADLRKQRERELRRRKREERDQRN